MSAVRGELARVNFNRLFERPDLQIPALSGQIEDCCCDVETVDDANKRHFLPILHDLTKRWGG
jgi:hypothetical protein